MAKSQKNTEYWWNSLPEERYWMEITDRRDIGADLKSPQADEAGKPQHSYSLIRAVWPGDIVFHYSTRTKAIVGASVAGGPLEERAILWVPHGTSGKSKKQERSPVPGWWLPLYGYRSLTNPLQLKSLHNPDDEAWVRDWVTKRRAAIKGAVEAPFQRYKGNLRGSQGYLTKMPLDFVNRWSSLSQLADDLGVLQEKINPLGDLYIPEKIGPPPLLKLKSEADYFAAILGSVQRRTRAHERLVRIAAECLTAHGSDATTPHPIDLRITHPKTVIFEVKPAANRNPIHAIREAVGQLLEYRYFLGPKDATLCIVLDENPGSMLTDFVEHWLGMRICWVTGNQLFGGPKTAEELAFCCLSDPATA